MNAELAEKLKNLRLRGLLTHWNDYLKLAADQRLSHGAFLAHVIEQECKIKSSHLRQLHIKKAGLPASWTIETYPFERQSRLDKDKIMALYDCLDYMTSAQNIIWIGPTGVGKTGLASSFVVHAIHEGYTGRYVLFADLIADFFQAAADHSENKVMRKYSSYDCLLIDELGYAEVEPAQVGQFFTLMQRRHKKRTTLVTSNLGFSEWGSFLKNAHLTSALIDRLTESSHVINMKDCESLRPTYTMIG